MALYKKQIRVERVTYGGQGFSDEIIPLTEWLDEEEGLKVLEKYREIEKREKWYCHVTARQRYVEAVGT